MKWLSMFLFHCSYVLHKSLFVSIKTAATPSPPPSKGWQCFPSSANVLLESGKSVKMSELQIGDLVQTGISSVLLFTISILSKVKISQFAR